MATSKLTLHPGLSPHPIAPAVAPEHAALGASVVTALTFIAVPLHGYHPYAEDGGVYLTGIKRLLDPSLYPAWSGFITAHLRFSLFAPLVALLVRGSGLGLMSVMFALYVASVWLTLFAAWQVATRCYHSVEARCGAVFLLAMWLPIPVAGTSLMLVDPYVSARSLSTPCGLLALAGAIDIVRALRQSKAVPWRSIALCAASLSAAFLVHPLMAAYALAVVLLLACEAFRRPRGRMLASAALCGCAILVAACIYRTAPASTADYLRVAQTRSYWFLARWHWYEICGAAAPLLILAAGRFGRRAGRGSVAASLAQAALLAGLTGMIVALLFARVDSFSYRIAELQPLRIFQMVYMLMILAIGASLGRGVLRHSRWRWLAMFVLLGSIAFLVQRATFHDLPHLELPWRGPVNGWEQGFVWIKDHTPKDAVFALDADYITADGEDSQNFRAIAERSALPDYSKDGGVASIAPRLSSQWVAGSAAQSHLDSIGDADRIAALHSSGAGWIVLSSDAATGFHCLYANRSIQVCRLPSAPHAASQPPAQLLAPHPR